MVLIPKIQSSYQEEYNSYEDNLMVTGPTHLFNFSS